MNKLEHMQPESCFPRDYSKNDSGRNPPLYAQENRQFVPPVKINLYTIGNNSFKRSLAADDLSNPLQSKYCSNGFWYNFLLKYIAGLFKKMTTSNKDVAGSAVLRKSVVWGCPICKAYSTAATADHTWWTA